MLNSDDQMMKFIYSLLDSDIVMFRELTSTKKSLKDNMLFSNTPVMAVVALDRIQVET